MTRLLLTVTLTSLALAGPFAASAESIDLKYDRTVPVTMAANDRALVEATRAASAGLPSFASSGASAAADYLDSPESYNHIR